MITKGKPPFAQHHLAITSGLGFLGHLGHIFGGQKLPFFDIDGPAGSSRCLDQVSLAAQQGRSLQNIHHLGGGLNLVTVMDIGNDR